MISLGLLCTNDFVYRIRYLKTLTYRKFNVKHLKQPLPLWHGVYPAATTQFTEDLALDVDATQRGYAALVKDGVNGLVVLGTCGENNSLEAAEKYRVLQAACEVIQGRVPVVCGVSELSTSRAVEYARQAEKIGVSALMVLPAMSYVPTVEELFEHFKAIAQATRLPIMLYNNPTAYRVSISFETLEKLTVLPNIVAIKESAADTRRFTDIINRFGERFTLMAGLDDVALEGLMLGASGWVSGLTTAFPRESVELIKAWSAGDLKRALQIYRWFMPLLHLDAEHDLVQSIKLAEQEMQRGKEWVRMPRLTLRGQRREEVLGIVRRARAAQSALVTL
jgi:1-pyrroline-4-hydroxy-2-carboxylate deaminase